jgi:CRP/FNR family transcriptional regulator, cyclic AMP receptor protein
MQERPSPTINLFKHEKDNLAFFEAGEIIMRTGDPGDCMYVVQEGQLDVIAGDGTIIESVGPGGIVGEMALVDNATRSATVIARTDSRVVPVNQEQFMGHVHRTPFFALQVMRIMTDRFRHRIALAEGTHRHQPDSA